MGAALGACLARHLIDNLNFEDLEVNVWSHSEIVLNWIASTKPLKKFVTNRISEIKGQAKHQTWRYCPTSENPVDLLNKGIKQNNL